MISSVEGEDVEAKPVVLDRLHITGDQLYAVGGFGGVAVENLQTTPRHLAFPTLPLPSEHLFRSAIKSTIDCY